MVLLDVAVPLALEGPLTYELPSIAKEGRGGVIPTRGCRVVVPLGKRRVTGMVWGRRSSYPDPERLKAIVEILDEQPVAPASLLDFIAWASEYYFHPLGMALAEALPPGFLSARSGNLPRPAVPGRSRLGIGSWSTGRIDALSTEQQEALREIDAALVKGGFTPFLLHGVTGSGKTEVYLRAAAQALETGRTVLVLVPEIAMTSQLSGLFSDRFGDEVALLHSALTEAQRRDQWLGIRDGRYRLVIGTRSAIFCPLQRIGLVVVDEEHDQSYKQEERFKYNARDLAIMRAKMEGAVVVLGSATPSVTTYHHAASGSYRLLEMPSRPSGVSLPQVILVDMRQGARESDSGLQKMAGDQEQRLPKWLSHRLYVEMADALDRCEQVLLYLNRRGYATYVFCPECGHVFRCRHCDVSLTWHRAGSVAARAAGLGREGALVCHYCGEAMAALPACPECKGQAVKAVGTGTERVVSDLTELFPKARTGRLDRDVVTSHRRLYELLRAFRDGEFDILVGTQMVTKGHDFPGLGLVGVVWADSGINLPEFNASERAFQLISQVAGRAGRRKKRGKVVIQTHMPDHHALVKALNHDYKGFYRQELSLREPLGYPPFGRLINFRFSGRSWTRVEEASKGLASALEGVCRKMGVSLLGPAPAPIGRIKGRFRFQFMLKAGSLSPLRAVAFEAKQRWSKMKVASVRLDIDADPVKFM